MLTDKRYAKARGVFKQLLGVENGSDDEMKDGLVWR